MRFIAAIVIAGALVACGGKSKNNTTPSNKGGTPTDTTKPAGGATYGGQTGCAGGAQPTKPAGGDPCGG